MQETQYSDGGFNRQFFQAKDGKELWAQMRSKYEKTMTEQGSVEVESIRQAVLNPKSRCPCGSGKLTKNCCIRRLRRYMSTELVKRYKPSSLRVVKRKPREVVYAIGYEDAPGHMGMWFGPTPVLQSCLEAVPSPCDEVATRTSPDPGAKDRPAFIIRFNMDGSNEKLYRWGGESEEWVRCQEAVDGGEGAE